MVKVWRLALAVFAVMLVDCAIRSGCAHVERGELGPRLPASEDLQTSKVIRTVAMLLVMVRSKIAPSLPSCGCNPVRSSLQLSAPA